MVKGALPLVEAPDLAVAVVPTVARRRPSTSGPIAATMESLIAAVELTCARISMMVATASYDLSPLPSTIVTAALYDRTV